MAFPFADPTRNYPVAVIAEGASASGVIQNGRGVSIGLIMPAEWTDAVLSFKGGDDPDDLHPIKQDGSYVTVAAAAGDAVVLDLHCFHPWRYFQIISGTHASPVNQDAARTIKIITRDI